MDKQSLEKLAIRFTDAFNRDDLDGVMSFFAEDAVYDEYHGTRHKGRDAIRAAFEPQFQGMYGAVRFESGGPFRGRRSRQGPHQLDLHDDDRQGAGRMARPRHPPLRGWPARREADLRQGQGPPPQGRRALIPAAKAMRCSPKSVPESGHRSCPGGMTKGHFPNDGDGVGIRAATALSSDGTANKEWPCPRPGGFLSGRVAAGQES